MTAGDKGLGSCTDKGHGYRQMGAAPQRRRRRWRRKGAEQGRRGNGLGLLFVPAPPNLPAPTREGDLTFLHLFCHISQFSHGERENSESPT